MHQVIEFYEQNLRLSRETGDARGELSALSSLARAYDALEERGKAVECYELALKIARQISDVRGERQLLKNLNEAQKPASTENTSGDQITPPRKPRRKTDSAAAKSTRPPASKPARTTKKQRRVKDQS